MPSTVVTTSTERPVLPTIEWLTAALVSAAIGLWIAVGEVDHLLAQLLDGDRSWSVSKLTGVSSLWSDTRETGWDFFHTAATDGPLAGDVAGWMHTYALFDSLLALTYVALAVTWAVRSTTIGTVLVTAAISLGGLGDLLEDLFIYRGGANTSGLAFAGWLKWVPLLIGLVTALIVGRQHVRNFLRHVPKALYTHRYSVLVVLPLAVLSLGRGPDLLEQLPDIQRRWADSDDGNDFWAAAVAMSALGLGVLAIGRQRTDHLWLRTCTEWTEEQHPCDQRRRYDPPTCPVTVARAKKQPMPLLRIWFIGAGLFLGSGLLLQCLTDSVVVWGRLLPFAAVPLVIGVSSLILRKGTEPETSKPGYRRKRPAIPKKRFQITALTGDILVGALPVVAGLGVIRAFTSVVALGEANKAAKALFIAGWGAVIAAWWVLGRFTGWLAKMAKNVSSDSSPGLKDRVVVALTPGLRTQLDATAQQARDQLKMYHPVKAWFQEFLDQPVAWGALVLSLVTLVWVGSAPVPWAESAGVVATFQVALGSLSILIGATVILVQRGEGPELFWKLGLPYAPVTALLMATALTIGLVGKWSDVHAIREYAGDEANLSEDTRPSLDAVFDDWLKMGTSCAEDLTGTDLKVRPLMLYAAEGGGIRAAYWAASAVDRISTEVEKDANPDTICRSAMIASGASGGSVGLSIASVLEPGDAREAVTEIAGPAALGAATDGLVLRDAIFAASGIALPSYGDHVDEADYAWHDRGTLIEQAWEYAIPELGTTPWLQPGRETGWSWGPTGALVVNSTSPTTSCRTLISQVELPGRRPDCSTDAAAPGSTDLVECTDQLRTTTAALLTARFPYVTPSGVVKCSHEDTGDHDDVTLQVVDGGYGDNTGVGTLVDLAPRIMQRVRQHNTCMLAAVAERARPATGCATDPALDTVVVPVLVYFDNGSGSDLVTRPGGLNLEVLVPPITVLGAKSALVSAASELQRTAALLGTAQLFSPGEDGDDIADAVNSWRGPSVFVVYQSTKPSIAAPLGWVLSDTSMRAMDDALAEQTQVCRLAPDTNAKDNVKAPLFGTIDQLLALLPDSPEGAIDSECD